MGWLSPVDWGAVFLPEVPILEIFVRGSVMYLGLFCLLRLVLKRQAGTLGMTDMLVLVLIADAAQNAMATDYRSIGDGLFLVATLIFWNFALEWLAFRFISFKDFIHPKPLALVEDGRIIHENMRKELITESDLMSRLRDKGVEHIRDVKRACMEGNGKISVVTKE
jgi:uncharacterized membrane protein YcaP (DUF421 family)